MRPSKRLLVLLLILTPLCASAQSSPADDVYVSDGAGLLQAPTVSHIAAVFREAEAQTKIRLRLVTTTDIGGRSPGQYGQMLIDQSRESGGPQQLVVVVAQGRIGFGRDDALDAVLTNSFLQQLLDRTHPLSEPDYDAGLAAFADGVAAEAARQRGVALSIPPFTPPAAKGQTAEPAGAGLSYSLVVIIGLLLIAAYFIHRYYRRGKLADIAATMGFTFSPDGTPDVSDISIFEEGDARRFRNLLKGTWRGLPTQVFDYMYRIGLDEPYWYRVTIVAFRLPNAELPRFKLGRNDVPFYGLQKELGWEASTSFSTHPEFERRWLLRGASDEAVRQLFQPPLLDFLLAPATDRNLHVESAPGGWLVLYKQHGFRGYHELRATQLPAFVEEMAVVAGAIFAEASTRSMAAKAAAGSVAPNVQPSLPPPPPVRRVGDFDPGSLPAGRKWTAALSWIAVALAGCLGLLWLLYHVGDVSEGAQVYLAIAVGALVVIGGIGLAVALFRMARDTIG